MAGNVSTRVKEILSWYKSENNGVLANLYRILNSGTLAGTGKLVILPVDQGFEHGPARSFAPNPAGYDPHYHFELALEAGCSAYAAPYGQIVAAHHDYAGQIPVIVKVNNNDSLYPSKNPVPAVTCSVRDALLAGASAIGFTIYPGSSYRKEMYQEIREMGEEARSYGLPVVIWSYPRGEGLTKEGETAVDVVAYAAQIACQLGAHIVKVKPPTEHIELEAARKVYEKEGIKISSLADRVSHVVQSAFAGQRLVVFSGGAAKSDEEVLEEIKALCAGGASGSIIGRNSFQRSRENGVKLLQQIMNIYKSAAAN
ncbi:MAG: class I fructose-bisphosphate aldolase [Candidatus Dadabacteria bacterium]|nr:MAG: class I fructose-bisphosphate aldolase [Candidatus Dadabacteria bacterium]